MATAEVNNVGQETRCEVFQFAQLGAAGLAGQEPKSWLVQIYPPQSIGRFVNLTDDCITLGRDDHSGMTFDDPAVSRHHAKIERVDDSYVVTDLGSRNGTFVNDQAVPSQSAGQWRSAARRATDSQIRRGRPVRGTVLRTRL